MPGPRPGTRPPSPRQGRLGRLLALVLRHKPDQVGLALDPAGFAPVDALAKALASQPGWQHVTAEDVLDVASADSRRYEIRDNQIRARYGHSIPVEEPGEPSVPPEWLYHGMSLEAATGIAGTGLAPTSRQYVHLSTTPAAAREVGRRHAPDAVVLVVFARRAQEAGVTFWRASPDLYLTGSLPVEFLLLPAERPGRRPSET